MATQEIPSSGGDYIENVEESSWQKGVCPPEWAQPTVLLFTDGSIIQFTDDVVLAFEDY